MTQRNIILLFLFSISVYLIYIYGNSIYLLATQHLQTDLTFTYLSGKMLNAHIPGYHVSKEYQTLFHMKKDSNPNLSPPFSVMLTALAAKYLSYKIFFIAFMTTAVSINIFSLIKLHQYIYSKSKSLYAFILINLIYMPSFFNIAVGQVALLLNALVIFSYLALEKRKDILAGFLFALAINIKLFFGIFAIFFFAQKRYAALLSFIMFSAIFAIIPIIIYGASIYKEYFSILSSVFWYAVNWNASFYGFFSRLLGDPNFKFAALFSFPEATKLIYNVVFFSYFFFIYFLAKIYKPSLSLLFSFTLSSMLLISPLGWVYYFPILITAFLINIKNAESHHYYPLFISLLLFSLFLSAMPFPLNIDYKITPVISVTQGNIFFISLLLLNIVNIMQITLPFKKNTAPIFSTKLMAFLIFICIFPSVIGITSIFIKNLNYKDHHDAQSSSYFAY